MEHPEILSAEKGDDGGTGCGSQNVIGVDAKALDVAEEPFVVVLLLFDVQLQIGGGLSGDGVAGEREGPVSGGAHERDSALHDAVELYQEIGKELG